MFERRLALRVLVTVMACASPACLDGAVGVAVGGAGDAVDAADLEPLDSAPAQPDDAEADADAAPEVAVTVDATPETDDAGADASPPIEDTDASPPIDDADASPPDDDADVSPPIEDTDASPPDNDADASPPTEDADVSPPDDDAVVGPEPLPPADAAELSAPPYLMWVTTSEVSVRWETKRAVIGRVDFGPTDALGATVEEPSERTTHELRLTGLQAAEPVSYRVVYGGGALPIRRFHTAPRDDDPDFGELRFIVWGDNQDGPTTFDALTERMDDFDPDFAISVGDCVQSGTRAEYRAQLFGPLSGLTDQVPFLVAAGNHERYGDPSASLFGEYFSQPGDEHCFGWRYGELFVLFLDTDLGLDGDTGQRACIEAALTSPAAASATLQAAAFHKPPRIEFWFGGFLAFTNAMKAPWVHDDLEPLLESLGVDLVFNGHNHLYAHTPPIATGGITWVTTGGGGGMLDTPGFLELWRVGRWPEIETTISQFHFLQVTVEAGEAFVEAVDVDGKVIHSFYAYGD